VALLQYLRHPRVLILMGVCRDMGPTEGGMGLIFELMESGSLYDLLHGSSEDAVSNRPSDLMAKLTLCLDIADGMRFLHSSRVLHRDLKSANILLDRDGRCKIADFGLSTLKDSTAASQTAGLMATPAWTDPEVALGAQFSRASDMYSFGVVVWEIFSGQIPWKGLTLMAVATQVSVQGKRLTIPETFPSAVRGLLSSCFDISPKRPDFVCAIRLIEEIIALQNGRRRISAPVLSEERIKQIMAEAVAPLHDALSRLEGQIGGLASVLQELGTELLTLNNPEGLSGLAEFWSNRMERLESLVLSSACDEGKIMREMRMIGNSLSNHLLELDLKVDPDTVVRELNKARDGIIRANAEGNEEMMSELLEDLKRMIAL
jgi:serine/threonine protein kinase